MKLENTVALVTGAGRRLGQAIAIALADGGSHLVVHYGRSREGAEETADAVRGLGREALTVSADLGRPEAIEGMFCEVEKRFGRLDVLVNSAASFERAPFEEITVESWDEVQAVNVRAPFLCTQHAACLMRQASGRTGWLGEPHVPGAVVNLADLAGVTAWMGYVNHGVSKAALLHLTTTSARELGRDARVNAVVPGPILPPPGEEPESDAWRARGERMPLGRTGEPAHVAGAVVFLARNDYVTGAHLFVDGGEHLLPGGRS